MRPQEAGSQRSVRSDKDVGTDEQRRRQRRVDGLAGPMDGLGGLVNGFFFFCVFSD